MFLFHTYLNDQNKISRFHAYINVSLGTLQDHRGRQFGVFTWDSTMFQDERISPISSFYLQVKIVTDSARSQGAMPSSHATRLDRLLLLLENGSAAATRRAAAEQVRFYSDALCQCDMSQLKPCFFWGCGADWRHC